MQPSRLASSLPSPRARRGLALIMLGLSAGQTADASDADRMKTGVGAAMLPRYEGSDKHRVLPVPMIDIQQGRFFARTGSGIGTNIIRTPDFTVGAAVNWMTGYRRKDVPEGIGKLSDALSAKLFVSTHLSGAILTVSAAQAITKSERGLVMGASVSYPYSITGRLRIMPSVSINWANAKSMDSYFGVSPAQSHASGLAGYRASSGFRDVSANLAMSYDLSRNWSVAGAVSVGRLLGDAADSPLVKRQTQWRGVVGVVYAF